VAPWQTQEVSSPSPRGPVVPSWLVATLITVVALVWLVSSLARFANPDRYPIPAEVHYLMGLALSMVGGAAIAIPRRRDIPPPDGPPPPPPEERHRAAEQ
jgi:hypothetical protein